MKIKFIATTVLSMALASVAFAETPTSSEASHEGRSYIGVKGGPMIIGHGIPFNDDGVLLGVLYGYDFPDNGIAIEGEFNTTVSKATSDLDDYGDLGVTTLAVYCAYRSSGRFYFKAKIGLLYEYLTSSVSGGSITIDVDGPGMAVSIGLGGGMHVTDHLSAEIEYTMVEADIGYASLGLNWAF